MPGPFASCSSFLDLHFLPWEMRGLNLMISVALLGLIVCDLKLIGGSIQQGRHSGGKILLTDFNAYSLSLCNLTYGEAQKSCCDFFYRTRDD